MSINFEDGFTIDVEEEVEEKKRDDLEEKRMKRITEKVQEFVEEQKKILEEEGFKEVQILSPESGVNIFYDESPYDELEEDLFIENFKTEFNESVREIIDSVLNEDLTVDPFTRLLNSLARVHIERNALGVYKLASSSKIKEILTNSYDFKSFHEVLFKEILSNKELMKYSSLREEEKEKRFIDIVVEGIKKWRLENRNDFLFEFERASFIRDAELYSEQSELKDSINWRTIFQNHKIDEIRFLHIEKVLNPGEILEYKDAINLNAEISPGVKKVVNDIYAQDGKKSGSRNQSI